MAGERDFRQCFVVTITEPKDLSLFSTIDRSKSTILLRMDGGNVFHIDLNGKIYQTSNNEIELPLNAGLNKLNVWTNQDCQGKIFKAISMDSGPMVYPNPFENNLHIVARENKSAVIEIHDLNGRLVYSRRHENVNGIYTINLQALTAGGYLLKTRTENNIETFKIIKR
jgi:hypothetical protein